MQNNPSIDDVVKMIARHPRQAILWTRSGIPSVGGNCTSYFGGLPRLPPSMEWPRITLKSPKDGSPYLGSPTFLGQIDFADIDKSFARKQRLPTAGVAYFFCDTAFVDNEPGFCVLFAPEGCANYRECMPPADLMRLTGGRFCPGRVWRGDDEDWSKVDFRYALTPHIFTSYRGWYDYWEEEWPYMKAYDRVQIAALEQKFGPLTRFSYDKEAPWLQDGQEWTRIIFPSWPISRIFYEEFRRAFEYDLGGTSGWYKPPTEASGPISIRFHEQIKADLARWSALLEGRDMFEPLPQTLREDVRNWFLALLARSHELNYGEQKARAIEPYRISAKFYESIWLAANMAIINGELGGVDDQVVHAALRERVESWKVATFGTNPTAVKYISRPMHQTLGYGESCQGAAEYYAADVLLLQISKKDCLGWQGAHMQVQFWINPKDLAAKRFDRVTMTAECD